MADELDGIDEVVEGGLRVALTVAGRVAEQVARAREQVAREAQAASEQQARELAARLDGERSAARASLAPVTRDEWWTHTQPQDIANAWETARAWQQLDPDAAAVADRIRREVRNRFGVDVDAPGGDPVAIREALKRAGLAGRDADHERREHPRDQAEAARLLTDADRADRAGEPDRAAVLEDAGQDTYDSGDRRRALAASLHGVADQETVQARVLADTFQARPAVEAVITAPKQAPVARTGRQAAVGRAGQRTEALDR